MGWDGQEGLFMGFYGGCGALLQYTHKYIHTYAIAGFGAGTYIDCV